MDAQNYIRCVCEGCNTEFEAVRPKRYCTRKCNKAAIRKNKTSVSRAEYVANMRENAASKFTCECCGIEAFRKMSGTNKAKGFVNRWCSMSCRSAAAAERNQNRAGHAPQVCACEICGAAFEAARTKKVCSDDCRKEKARRATNAANRRNVGNKPPCACRHCGTVFAPIYGDKRSVFCSVGCQRKYEGKRRGNDHRKRARYYGVAYEPVNRLRVFDRDGWRCQICGKNTPRARLGGMTSNAPELDHRTPLSKGGGHLYSNVQCACRSCNIAKGNGSEVGQLPLLLA